MKTSSRPLFEVKASGLHILVSIYFDSLNLACNKSKLYKTINYWSRDMLNFNFFEKGLGIVSTQFAYDFSKKIFFMLYSINWPNSIAWLPLILEIMSNMFIAIVCFPGFDVINFDINLIFLIKPLLCLTKKSSQKFKYL